MGRLTAQNPGFPLLESPHRCAVFHFVLEHPKILNPSDFLGKAELAAAEHAFRVVRTSSGSYPQFSTELSTLMWITSAHLWTDVDNCWITAVFADITWFLRNAQKRNGDGRHDGGALHISIVSIVDRFAVCSETAFSYGSIGALPQTPQGAPPLDPARDFIP